MTLQNKHINDFLDSSKLGMVVYIWPCGGAIESTLASKTNLFLGQWPEFFIKFY